MDDNEYLTDPSKLAIPEKIMNSMGKTHNDIGKAMRRDDMLKSGMGDSYQQALDIKKQTEITKQQLDQARQEQNAEKRRIEEKQIRALRGNYSHASGDLGSGVANPAGMSNKLGG